MYCRVKQPGSHDARETKGWKQNTSTALMNTVLTCVFSGILAIPIHYTLHSYWLLLAHSLPLHFNITAFMFTFHLSVHSPCRHCIHEYSQLLLRSWVRFTVTTFISTFHRSYILKYISLPLQFYVRANINFTTGKIYNYYLFESWLSWLFPLLLIEI